MEALKQKRGGKEVPAKKQHKEKLKRMFVEVVRRVVGESSSRSQEISNKHITYSRVQLFMCVNIISIEVEHLPSKNEELTTF